MIVRLRSELLRHRLSWAICAFGLVTGCAGPAADHEEEAHVVPAHHPRTFRKAVAEIGSRGAVLASGGLDEETRGHRTRELLDILRWLPELAADTELGRRDWERVRDAARRLGERLEACVAVGGRAPDSGTSLEVALEQALETLAEADSSLPPGVAGEETT